MPLYEIDRLDAEPNLQQFSVLKVIVLITCCITYVLHGITTCLGCPGINLQPLFVFLYIIFEIVSFVSLKFVSYFKVHKMKCLVTQTKNWPKLLLCLLLYV